MNLSCSLNIKYCFVEYIPSRPLHIHQLSPTLSVSPLLEKSLAKTVSNLYRHITFLCTSFIHNRRSSQTFS